MADVADSVLAARAAQGDVRAFERLVRRHQVRIYRLCLHMLGAEEDAAEVAQDVFFTVWRAIGKFRGDSSFGTWLYRIATNHCLNFLRKRAPAMVPLMEQASVHGQPEAEFEARQMGEKVGRAIAALTPEQRAPLLLREVEGLHYAEIAQILDLSVAAVKSRLNRARVEVARALEDVP